MSTVGRGGCRGVATCERGHLILYLAPNVAPLSDTCSSRCLTARVLLHEIARPNRSRAMRRRTAANCEAPRSAVRMTYDLRFRAQSFFPITVCGITRWPNPKVRSICSARREGERAARATTRIRVPGDGHENLFYHSRPYALDWCPWLRARTWRHSHAPSLLGAWLWILFEVGPAGRKAKPPHPKARRHACTRRTLPTYCHKVFECTLARSKSSLASKLNS